MGSRRQIHENIYFISVLGIALGLPFNKIVLSISGLLMAANWLLEGNYREKLVAIKSQKAGSLLAVLFIFLSFTLLYSSNQEYGVNDLRIKLPLLLFPIVILSSSQLGKTKYNIVIHTFLVSVAVVTLINYINYNTGIYRSDSREMSLFGSHIRLSLMVTFAFFSSLFLIWKKRNWKSVLYLLFSLWFLFYAYKSEVLTGYFGMVVTFVFLLFWMISIQFKNHKTLAFAVCLGLTALISFIFYKSIYPIPEENFTAEQLAEKTKHGGTYHHDTMSIILENGYFIHYFICHEELDSMLSITVGKTIDELKVEQADFFPTLIRYMSSLGLRKDADGFSKLSTTDLDNIFKGIPSVVYAEGGIKSRLARITMELQKHLEGADPNGSTIQQRIEYWKTGKDIIKAYPIFGVGIGDVQDAFNTQYEINNSRLYPENRLHSHQQFMTIWISGGIIALALLLMHIVLSLKIAFEYKSILLYLFVVIITFSYFFEDTLETQVGVTLTAFFLSLLLKHEQEDPFYDSENQKA
jgi:hypothetical protein